MQESKWKSQEDPGGPRKAQEGQEGPGGPKKEGPGGPRRTRKTPKSPGEPRRSQEEPGGSIFMALSDFGVWVIVCGSFWFWGWSFVLATPTRSSF